MVNNVWISAVTSDNISRKDAIAWVNDTLASHLTKVEEMSNAAAYCQMTHLLFGNRINIKKVKFNPKNEPEVLANWKLLTTSWKDIGIDKPVDVEKLKKAKFQDNMEFLQWFYKFFNANYDGKEYDPLSARLGEDLPALSKGPGARGAPAARPVAQRPKPVVATTTRVAPKAAPPAAAATSRAPPAPVQPDPRLAELEELTQQLETERDFYFGKLRDVEDVIKKLEEEGQSVVETQQILNILYEGDEATAEQNETHDGGVPVAASQDDDAF